MYYMDTGTRIKVNVTVGGFCTPLLHIPPPEKPWPASAVIERSY